MKYITIMASLIKKLNDFGLKKEAGEMINLLNDLIDSQNDEDDPGPVDVAISGNGLRDGPTENMNQGFSVEPFYFH